MARTVSATPWEPFGQWEGWRLKNVTFRAQIAVYLRIHVPVVVDGMITFVTVWSKTSQTHPASAA